jgi:hypothetical protein
MNGTGDGNIFDGIGTQKTDGSINTADSVFFC